MTSNSTDDSTGNQWLDNGPESILYYNDNTFLVGYISAFVALAILAHSYYLHGRKFDSVRIYTDLGCLSTALAGLFLYIGGQQTSKTTPVSIFTLLYFEAFGPLVVQLSDSYMFYSLLLVVRRNQMPMWERALIQLFIWVVLIGSWLPTYTIVPIFFNTNNNEYIVVYNALDMCYIFGALLYNFYFTGQCLRIFYKITRQIIAIRREEKRKRDEIHRRQQQHRQRRQQQQREEEEIAAGRSDGSSSPVHAEASGGAAEDNNDPFLANLVERLLAGSLVPRQSLLATFINRTAVGAAAGVGRGRGRQNPGAVSPAPVNIATAAAGVSGPTRGRQGGIIHPGNVTTGNKIEAQVEVGIQVEVRPAAIAPEPPPPPNNNNNNSNINSYNGSPNNEISKLGDDEQRSDHDLLAAGGDGLHDISNMISRLRKIKIVAVKSVGHAITSSFAAMLHYYGGEIGSNSRNLIIIAGMHFWFNMPLEGIRCGSSCCSWEKFKNACLMLWDTLFLAVSTHPMTRTVTMDVRRTGTLPGNVRAAGAGVGGTPQNHNNNHNNHHHHHHNHHHPQHGHSGRDDLFNTTIH